MHDEYMCKVIDLVQDAEKSFAACICVSPCSDWELLISTPFCYGDGDEIGLHAVCQDGFWYIDDDGESMWRFDPNYTSALPKGFGHFRGRMEFYGLVLHEGVIKREKPVSLESLGDAAFRFAQAIIELDVLASMAQERAT